ncbi:pyridoxal-phosphate dependent enzyme [Asticcacaulis sp. DXS10W]|uniref:Pyridoxal-phosphate dependent enzyme n=1 Tax=Asticcacaulis currens TaxID=2984210 RepID=A0ABT5IDG8_9CAUL|nr:pyridoxal-phosphate dependent enzyme [Asticcacaulis currens]MDC7694234.1 pyridoxal-phosphate dependent enzyme [Asticcacaulis currens]
MTYALDKTLIRSIWPAYRPTPLIEADGLASRFGLARVFVKNETLRPLGNFKSLGGMTAGLSVLMERTGARSIEALGRCNNIPALICASDGNHGLAVAAAAHHVNGRALIIIPRHVSPRRVAKIRALGAEVVQVSGTYDDAVMEARRRAENGSGVLVADTTDDRSDPTVQKVVAGYGLMVDEMGVQFHDRLTAPTHIFVQAGVGGLAAALADGFASRFSTHPKIVVVEPKSADCVSRALIAGRPVQCPGNLRTMATMLSCGVASAPALASLLAHRAQGLTLSETELRNGSKIAKMIGVPSTASGAAGLAGLKAACRNPNLRATFGINERSRVLTILTEGSQQVTPSALARDYR